MTAIGCSASMPPIRSRSFTPSSAVPAARARPRRPLAALLRSRSSESRPADRAHAADWLIARRGIEPTRNARSDPHPRGNALTAHLTGTAKRPVATRAETTGKEASMLARRVVPALIALAASPFATVAAHNGARAGPSTPSPTHPPATPSSPTTASADGTLSPRALPDRRHRHRRRARLAGRGRPEPTATTCTRSTPAATRSRASPSAATGLVEATVPSGGTMPISLTVHGQLLYVLNAGGAANISGFGTDGDGLTPIAGSTRPWAPARRPGADLVHADGGVARRDREDDELDRDLPVDRRRADAPPCSPPPAATPFGFDFDKRGNLLDSNAGRLGLVVQPQPRGRVNVISGAVPTPGGARAGSSRPRTAATPTPRTAAPARSPASRSAATAAWRCSTPSGVTANLGAGTHPLDETVTRRTAATSTT